MVFCRTQRKVLRGPGKNPALLVFSVCLVEAFVLTQTASSADFRTFQTYTPSVVSGSDAGTGGGRDAQFDAKRAVERFQQRSRQDGGVRRRGEEKERDEIQVRQVQENVIQEQKVSREIAQQQSQEAAAMVARTSGLDTFSMGKDGSVWHSHVALLVHAWNVLSRDLYGNESRSELTNFKYNDLLNATGMNRQTVDQAGRITETSISDIAYNKQSLRNYLNENEEATRIETTTTFHPTGNQVSRSRIFDVVYMGGKDDRKVIAQKAEVTPLSGPDTGKTVLQETFDMEYDGDNVIRSKARATEIGTGTLTTSVTKNAFSGHRLISGVTESTIKDFVNRTFTEQTFTQNVSYNGGGIQALDSKSTATTRAMDEKGNTFDDFVTTTETIQVMGIFSGIPNPVEVVSVSKNVDNVNIQTSESRQLQRHVRDRHGNLLGVSATEDASSFNADRSVIQNTTSTLDFLVKADQPYLTGRIDQTLTKDLINEQDLTSTSQLLIRLDDVGRVLEGTRASRTQGTNKDGSITSHTEATETFDRAEKANALGLIKRESVSRTVNSVLKENISVTEEKRLYTQRHDDANRVLEAHETVSGLTKDSLGTETAVSGSVAYAVGSRTNQVYAVESTNKIVNKNPFDFLYTESTQMTRFESDAATGRSLRGRGITEGLTYRMTEEGLVRPDLLVIRSRSEDFLEGLAQSNGLGLRLRHTLTETDDIVNSLVTQRDEKFYQEVNGVGKIQKAFAISEGRGKNREGEMLQTYGLTRTDFQLIRGNDVAVSSVNSVDVTANHMEGSYRVVAKSEAHRRDDMGRYLNIDEKHPEKSGFQMTFYHDVTVRPIPQEVPNMEQLFHRFFGTGATR